MRARALPALIAIAALASNAALVGARTGPDIDDVAVVPAHVRLVQFIDASDIGLTGVSGVAYAAGQDALLVTGSAGGGPVAKGVTRLGHERFSSALPADLGDTVAIAYDAERETVIGVDAAGDLTEIAAPGGRPGNRSSPAPRVPGLGRVAGVSAPAGGNVVALDAAGRRVIELDLASGSAVAATPLTGTNADLVGLAVDADGTYFSVDASGSTIYTFGSDGALRTTRNIADAGLTDPTGAVLAPSADPTDAPTKLSLFVADSGGNDAGDGGIAEFELAATPLSEAALAATNGTAVLVSTIATSNLNPSSPDPSGITYNGQADRLVMTDGEIEEENNNTYPYPGKNGWAFTRTQPVQTTQTFDTTTHTCQANGKNVRNVEPVGIARNPSTGTYYVVRDGENVLWELSSSFTPIRCLGLNSLGVADTEGIGYGGGAIWIADGTAAEIWRIVPGPDGVFGTATGGGAHDETATHFDTAAHGQPDPEGVEYDSATGTLYVVSNKDNATILEISTTGQPIRILTPSGVALGSARGLTLAPGTNETDQHIWVADARDDNNENGGAFDGLIYEFDAGGSTPPPDAPETTITSGPSGTVTATDATFTFTGSAETTAFECRLDGSAFSACASPTSYTGLTATTHTFEVRALAGSVADPTPAARTWTIGSGQPPGGNLLRNPSFELDANVDSIPDDWGSNARFTRSIATPPVDGSFVGRHLNNNSIIRQEVAVSAGTQYQFTGMVKLPATSDAFSFQINVQWRAGSSNVGSPVVIHNFVDDTAGAWVNVAGTLTAPAGATKARIQMDGNSMNTTGTAYVDAFFFGAGAAPPPPLDTQITSGPPSSTTATSATFEFSGTSASSFECQLDAGGWSVCTSPTTVDGLSLGSHTFSVRAVGAGGAVDDTPASRTWNVVDTQPSTNLLTNAGFEMDADSNSIPDDWGTKTKFTRSAAIAAHSGGFAGRHFADNDSGYTIFQEASVNAGTSYAFGAWVNIPPTADAFSFYVRVRWMTGTTVIRTITVGTFTRATTGWQEVSAASLAAPAGATSARVMMAVNSLNGSIYVDDFSLTALP